MADERTTPVNPKWGPLPDSLSDKTRKKPCEGCGLPTVGSQGSPKIRVAIDGSVLPPPRHLCAECCPDGHASIIKRNKALERKSESYRSHR